MSDYLTNPHDKFFKDLFSRQEAARDFLQYYLPSEVAVLLDLTTLQIHKDSFIDPDLQEHFSDLLYQVTLQSSGQDAYIYILFEHKSYPDPLIALQLLRYMVRIWEQSLKQEKPLLPVLPLVMYHGSKQWTVATEFTALFELPAELKPYVPSYRYWLCDLSQYSEAEIKARIQSAIILQIGLLLLKYEGQADFLDRLDDILELLWQLSRRETALEYLETILRYVVSRTDKGSVDQVKQIISRILQEGESLMPTIAEQWLEQGRLEGRLEGREEGREVTLNILRRILAMRFGLELNHFDAHFTPLDLKAITTLSEAVFEVESQAEFETILFKLSTAT